MRSTPPKTSAQSRTTIHDDTAMLFVSLELSSSDLDCNVACARHRQDVEAQDRGR